MWCEKKKNYLKKSILFFVFNFLFLIFCSNILSNSQKSVLELYINNEKNENASSGSMRLTSINADGKELKLSNFRLTEEFLYDSTYDDIVYLYKDIETECSLKLPLGAYKEIKVTFATGPESGIIGIKDGNLYQKIDLYNQTYDAYFYNMQSNRLNRTFLDISVSFLARLIFVSLIGLILFFYARKKTGKKEVVSLHTITVCLMAVIQNYFLLLYVHYYVQLDFIKIVLVSSIFLWGSLAYDKILVGEKKWAIKIILWISIVYMAFSFWGSSIFLPIDKIRIQLRDVIIFAGMTWSLSYTIKRIIYVFVDSDNNKVTNIPDIIVVNLRKIKGILGGIWFALMAVLLYYITKDSLKLGWIIILISMFMISMLMAIKLCYIKGGMWKYFLYSAMLMFPLVFIFNPGNMTPDSFDQYMQIQGMAAYTDHHPIMHTLFEKLLLQLVNNVMIISAFQVLLLSYINARTVNYLYRKGVNYNYTLFILAMWAMWPSTQVMSVTIWKDVLFGGSILWITVLVAEIYDECGVFYKSVWKCFEFICAMFIMATFRHNGMFVLIGLSGLFIINAYNKKNRRAFLYVFATVGLILGTKKMVFEVNDVRPNGNLVSVVLFHGMAYEEYLGIPLSEPSKKYLDSVMPEQTVRELYTPYSASSYMYTAEAQKNDALNKFRNSDLKEVLNSYLIEARRHPYIIIKDRLYGTDLLWNVNPEKLSYNFKYSADVGVNSLGLSRKYTPFDSVMKKILLKTNSLKVVWRGGVHVNILLILLLVGILKKKKNIIFVLSPTILTVISLYLSMAWQDYRYVWFLWLVIPFIFSYVIVAPLKKE